MSSVVKVLRKVGTYKVSALTRNAKSTRFQLSRSPPALLSMGPVLDKKGRGKVGGRRGFFP